ncbi:MAG: cobalamin biosynthesis protein CobD [Chloroflexi bacterium]|nr:cobalamin biosynthesis protein CobD [Chloroflexota bacterium]
MKVRPSARCGDRCAVILLAFFLDRVFGDPPNRWHPVAWMGRWIGWGKARAAAQDPLAALLSGAAILASGILGVGTLAAALERWARGWPRGVRVLGMALLLKSTFSLRGLERAALQVHTALLRRDLPAARHWLRWHLVSRETKHLAQHHIVAATVESLAENTSDGVIAPLLYYLMGGLPAAMVYRFINTADAMLGYREGMLEWLGKIPARVDDGANFLPARLTAGLFVLAAPLVREDAAAAWRTWREDARATSSPNAGHPMAAMAGALRVELEKVGHYRLGRGFPHPTGDAIPRAIRLVRAGVGLFLMGVVLAHLAGGKDDPTT